MAKNRPSQKDHLNGGPTRSDKPLSDRGAARRRHLTQRKRRQRLWLSLILLTLLVLSFTIAFVVVSKKLDRPVTLSSASLPDRSSLVSSEARSVSEVSVSSSSSPSPSLANVAPWLNTRAENYLPTLMYHNIETNTPNGNYISPTTFESTLAALKADGVYTVSSDEALKILTSQSKPADKIIWLTFDDGAQSFYDNVFPLLKKYQLHATSFIITSKVITQVPGFLTANEIKEMAATGLVDFQSHTVDHIDLSQASDASQTAQLQDSKAYLDGLLNQKTHVICYPSGSHNLQTPEIASSLGYDLGLLDPGRTYVGVSAINAAAKASEGLFLLNRYRTFTETGGEAVRAMISADEAYNVTNTLR